jgi:putative inorganic carbon (HCO3(-)) transporter
MSYATRISSAPEGVDRAIGSLVPPLFLSALVTWLVYRYEAPIGLAAILVGTVLVFLLARPAVATLAVVFLLYTNIPAVLHTVYGVPQLVAGSILLLLAIPLAYHTVLRRAPVRLDGVMELMLCFLVVLLLSSLAAKDKSIAFDRVLEYAIEGLLLYWLFLNVVRDVATLRRVIAAALLAGSLLASLNIYQSATGDYRRDFGGLASRQLHLEEKRDRDLESGVRAPKLYLAERAQGPQYDSNYLAQFMVVLLPLAWLQFRNGRTRRGRLCAAGAGVLILVGVFLTYSRGGLLAFFAVALLATCLGWLPWRRVLVATVCAALLLPAIAPVTYQRITSLQSVAALDDPKADLSLRGRATEMLAALHVVMDYPLLGVGPGQYKPFYSIDYHQIPAVKFRDLQQRRRAHNLYLEMAAETGLIGITLFLVIPLVLLRDLWNAQRRLARENRELADTAVALLLSIIGFLLAAMFLTLAYQRYYWFLLALAGASLGIMRSVIGRLPHRPPSAGGVT